jgi:hypothetical protein
MDSNRTREGITSLGTEMIEHHRKSRAMGNKLAWEATSLQALDIRFKRLHQCNLAWVESRRE